MRDSTTWYFNVDMTICCVKWCRTRTGRKLSKSMKETGVKISFHRVPEDPALLEEFCRRIGRKTDPSFQISRATTICSQHYKDEDFYAYETGTRRLKPNALPSVFLCRPNNEPNLCEEDTIPRVLDDSLVENSEVEPDDRDCESRTPSPDFATEPSIIITNVESLAQCAAEQYSDPLEGLNVTNFYIDEQLEEKERPLGHGTYFVKPSKELKRVQADLRVAQQQISSSEKEIVKLKSQLENTQSSLQQAQKEREEFHFKVEVAKLRYDLQKSKVDMKSAKEKEETQTVVEELAELKKHHQQLIVDLQSLSTCIMSFETIKDNSKRLKLYTGIESVQEFDALYDCVGAGKNGENVVIWRGEAESKILRRVKADSKMWHKMGRRRKLSGKSQFLVVLCRVHLNLGEQDLARRFGVSQATICRIFTSWIQFLSLRLGSIKTWPSKDCENYARMLQGKVAIHARYY